MATLIRTDGTEEIIRPAGKKFTLMEMSKLIGCVYVQVIRLPGGKTMWMDDKTNVLNVRAMVLLREAGGHPGDAVVGDVLICEHDEVS